MSPTASLMSASHVHAAAAASTANSTSSSVVVAAIDATCDHRPCAGEPFGHYVVRILHPAPGVFTDLVAACACLYLFRSDPHELKSLATYWAALKAGEVEALRERGCLNRSLSTAGGSTFFSSGSGGEAGGGGVIVAPPPSLQTNLCAASLGSPPTNGGGLPFLPPASACGAAAFARTASVASMVSAASPTYSPQSAGVGLGGAAVGTPFAGAAVYGGIGRPLLSTDDMLPLSTGCCGAGCGSPAVVLSPAMSNAPASFAAFVGGGGASTVAAACGGSAAVPAVVAAPTPRDVIEQCAKVHAHTERARLRRQLEEEERRMALEAAAKRERGEKGSASPGRVRRGSLSVGDNLGGSRCGTPAQRSSAAATPRATAQRKRASLFSEDSHHSSQQPMKSKYEDPTGAAAAAAGAAACNAYSNSDHHHELFEESLLLDADADAAEAERLQREQRTSSIALGGSERRVRGVEGRSLSVSAASSASAEGSSRQSASGLNRSPTTSSVYPPNPIAVSATAKCAPQFALPPSSPSPSVVAGARHPHPHHHHVMTTPTLLASGGTCSVDCPPPKRTSNDLLAVMHIGAATDADGGGGASVTSSALQQPSSMAAAAAAAQKGSLSPRQQQQQQHGLGAPQASSVMAIGDRDVSLPPSPTASAASRSSSAAALSAVAPSPRQQQDDQGRASPADTSVVQYVSAATAAAACAEERLSEDQLVEHLLTTLQYCLDTYFSHNWSSVEGTLQVNADHKAYVEREIIPRLARHRKEEAANGYSIAANKYTSTAGPVVHVTSEEAPPSQAPSSPSASASSPAPSSVPTSGSSSSNTSGSARPAGLAIPLPAAAADNNSSNSTNTHSNGVLVCPVSASATPMGRADTNAFAAAEEALGADASAIAVASKDSTVANTDASSEEEEEEEDNVTPAGHPSSAGAEGLHITAPPAALQQGQNAVPASPNEAPPVSTSSAFSIPPNIRWATARNFSRLRAEAAESGLLLVFHAPFSQPSCQALMLFDALFRNELRSAEAAKAAWEEIKVRRRLPMCGPTESPTAAAMATPTASTDGAPASAAAAAAGIHKNIVALPSSAVSTSSAIYPYPSSSIASSSAFFATCVPEPPDFTPPKWAVVNSLREPILYNAFKVSWFPTIVYIPPVLADDDETDDGGSSCGGDLLADSSSSSSSFCDEESDACSSASDESVDGSSSSSSNSLEAAQPPSQLEAGGGGPTANNAVLLLRPPPRGRAATTAAPTPVQSLSIAQSHVTDPLPEAAVGPSTAADEQFTSIAAAQNGPPLPSSSSYQPPPIATESATTLCYQSPKLVLGDLQVQGEAPPTGAIGTAAAGSQAPPKMTTETINPLGTTTLVVGAVAALGGGGLSDPLSVSRMSQSVGVRAAAERRGEAIPLVSSASTAAPSESTVGVGPISTTDGSKRERIPHKQSSHTHHHAAGRAACTLARTLTAATDNHITYPEKGIRQPRYLLEWLIRRGQGGAYERRVKGTITTFAVLSKQKQFVSKRREISGALSLKKRQIHDPNPLPHSAEDPPVFVIMGGGMAAGKTTATSALEMTSWWRRHGNNAVVIDADEFKFQDPLFKANSPDLHRKSVEAAEQLLVDSLNEGRDIVFDGTMSWLPYVQQTLEMVRDAHRFLYKRCTVAYRPREGLEEYWERWRPRGPTDASLPAPYVVKFVGITVDPSRAVQRGILRRVNTGRSVPVRPQLRSFALFAHGFLTYAAWADSVVLYNNNVRVDLSAGQLPKVIAEKRHGQIDHSQFGGSATTTQNSNNYSQSRMGSTAGNSPAAEPREAGDSPPEQDTAEAASPPTNSSFRNTLGLSSPFSPSESLPRDHPTIVAAQQQQQQFASNGSASGGSTAPLVSAPQQQQQQQQSLPFLFGGPATVNGLPPPPSCLIIHDPIAFSDFLQHTHINQNATSEEDLWLPKPVIPDWEKERLLRRHELAAERAADEAAEEAASQTANANGRTVPFIASSGATLKSRFLSAATTTSILGTSPSLDEYCPSTSDDEAETEVVTTKAKGSEEQSQSETNGEDQKAASNAKSDSGHGSASPPLIVVVPSAEEDSPLPSLDRSARPELALSDEARYIQQHFVPPNANAGAGIFGVGGRGHHQHHHHHHHHHSHRSPPPLGAPSAKARPPLSGQATEEVRNMPDAAAGSPLPLPSSSQPRRVDSEALSFPSSPAGTPTSLSLAQSQGPKYSSSHALGRGGNANSGSSPFVYGDGGGALRFPAMPAVLGGRGHLFASTDTLPSWANDSLAPLRRQCTAEIAGVMVPSTPPAVPLHRQQEDEKRLRRSTASSTETIT